MNKLALLAASVLLVAAPGKAFAQQRLALDTGNDFVSMCADKSYGVMWGMCYGYLAGYTQRDAVGPSFFCVPPNVTNGQIFDVVMKHIVDRPQDRHHSLKYLTLAALSTAFPCPKK